MNTIIEQLAQDATEDILGVKILNRNKFAELIIRECIDLCEQGTSTQTTSSGAANMIRQHFGVNHD